MKLSDLTKGKEDVTAPIAGQFSNSIAYILAGVAILGPVVVAGELWLSNRILPVDQAQQVNDLIMQIAKAVGGAVGLGGPVGLFARSLMLTQGKVAAQIKSTEPDVPGNKAPDPVADIPLIEDVPEDVELVVDSPDDDGTPSA